MLIEPRGIKTLDGEHRRQLGRAGLRRTSTARYSMRTALAGTLVAWAARLAPETGDTAVLRTRAAPS
jgi:hypothetical protein